MPTYLCHGFRWHRRSIRTFIVVHDIEDAAPEWIVAPLGRAALLDNIHRVFDFLPDASSSSAAINGPSPRTLNDGSPVRRRDHGHVHARSLSEDSSHHSYGKSHERHTSAGDENDLERVRGASAGAGTKGPSSPSISRKRSKSFLRWPKPSEHEQEESPDSSSSLARPTLGDGYARREHAVISLLEEYDASDETRVCAPWAYVADHVVRVDTSVSLAEEISRYEKSHNTKEHHKAKAMHGPSDETGRKIQGAGMRKAGWFEKLRDHMQKGESIRWYVVVCADEERGFGGPESDVVEEGNEVAEDEDDEGSNTSRSQAPPRPSQSTRSTQSASQSLSENGFEFRLPELIGLAPKTSSGIPERKRKQAVSPRPKTPNTDSINAPASPPPGQVTGQSTSDTGSRPRSPWSSNGGIRKLFSRRNTETSNS
ncbi:hypothetical protein F5Y15DRAFT_396610 [Xylariaceae sp. FL0016]|nr:hypothetical protein F5Y15DRAFT_396610 [Xylariaceae sp. FL0016]